MIALGKIDSKSKFTNIALSSITSIFFKLISFFCTFILTRIIIGTYGSEINGMLSSITQYLSIIVLLEGGVGGVARAVLYKPLAEKNNLQIRKIITYVEKFFRILALFFILYSIILAFIFPSFATEQDFWFSFSLVLIVATSIFCEYFFGMAYSVLMAADQKVYIVNIITFISTILNFIICVLLIFAKFPIHIVKIASAAMLMIRPIFLLLYCRKKYKIKSVKLDRKENLLPEKWSGLGAHLAFYLHRNTDTFLITIFLSFTMVSVYSVYNLVIGGILTIIGTLSIGIEAAFGNMYAKKEFKTLKNRFKIYVFYYQFLTTFLMSSSLILILPFIKIYTAGVTDANYIQPLFSTIFIISEFVYCLRVPFNDLMIATNSFKKIQIGAYIEAGINIILSVVLINFLGLIGVVVGTLFAMVFRVIHFLVFFKKHIFLNLEIGWFLRLTFASLIIMVASCLFSLLLNSGPGLSYTSWAVYAVKVCFLVFTICLILYSLLCKKQTNEFLKFLSLKFFKKANHKKED